MPAGVNNANGDNILSIAHDSRVGNICVWCATDEHLGCVHDKISVIEVASLSDTALFANMAHRAESDFVVCVLKSNTLLPAVDVLSGMCEAMNENSSMLYCDYRKNINGELCDAPVIDYHKGCLRNDFDFGSVVVIRTKALKAFVKGCLPYYRYAGFYQLRLFLSRAGELQHLCKSLYVEEEFDLRRSGEKQFDYVNPAQRNVQIEMEEVCSEHLKLIGAWLPPFKYTEIDLSNGIFPVEASVVIPVLNRVSTIADAVSSVLGQVTTFKFNILVVDNHSTDGTSEVIDSFNDERVCHIIPERTDLGIGGCWNYAINSEHCGRFAIQLDSDDIYSDTDTLQRIVDEFYKQQCAMLIGSYRICDFNLNTLPPGIIDHREWSEENGRNNALRINGLGAPRAFFTPIVREVGFPNVSYGEDYAVGLAISRKYRIGRIYDVLYLCRRWDGNSDAALSHTKINAHNTYKDSLRTDELLSRMEMLRNVNAPFTDELEQFFDTQLASWEQVKERFCALKTVKTRKLKSGITLQYNPARMISTAADIRTDAVKERPCFLCKANRPGKQYTGNALFDVELLVNPYPILPMHFTLPLKRHTPQRIVALYYDMLSLAQKWLGMVLFYNGAECGASAPDHAHLQAVRSCDVPILNGDLKELVYSHLEEIVACDEAAIYRSTSYVVPLFILKSKNIESMLPLFDMLYKTMSVNGGEPMINVLSYNDDKQGLVTIVFPRKQHRPACYYAEGEEQRLVSPGLLDMAGLMITPREKDFEIMTNDEVVNILQEVAIDNTDANDISQKIKIAMCGNRV